MLENTIKLVNNFQFLGKEDKVFKFTRKRQETLHNRRFSEFIALYKSNYMTSKVIIAVLTTLTYKEG